MKLMKDMLLRKEPFSEIVMGNTALVRAMIETGTRVVTSYPGSPTPEIAQAIGSIPKDQRPFYFEFSTNEKVATEVAYGAALNGYLACVFFKSVGLNVAADTFVQLSLMNIIGGMVIVLGDDPGANSSQNEQDNRHIARMAYTPVLEPADPTEVYTFYKRAAQMARENQMPVILRMTTHVCHAKQKVAFDGWQPETPEDTPRFDVANGPYIPLTSMVFPMKHRALQRLDHVAGDPVTNQMHRIVDNGNPAKGIITMGLPFLSVMEVLEHAREKPDILKLAMVYPLDRQTIVRFLKDHEQVCILEELDDILETDIKSLAFDEGIRVKIHGKTDHQDRIGELTPDKVDAILRKIWPEMLPDKPGTDHQDRPEVVARPAQLCPGCGHRSAFFAIKQALRDTDITVADIGCHTLGFLPPYEVGQLLMCMGASNGMGAGLSLFNKSRRVVTFLGDSTFFHAGIPGVINAIFNNHNITLIVMENGTTAMTGHQDHAASGRNFNGPTDTMPIRQVLEGLGVKHIFDVDTYQQAKLTEAVRQAMAIEGFSVVIARHPCMLKFTRTQRKKPGFQLRQVAIDPDTCRRAYTCVEQFGCPTFNRDPDGRVRINPDLCIGDGSCIQTCPETAIQSAFKK